MVSFKLLIVVCMIIYLIGFFVGKKLYRFKQAKQSVIDWNMPNKMPFIDIGTDVQVLVSVYRSAIGKVCVFQCAYLNALELTAIDSDRPEIFEGFYSTYFDSHRDQDMYEQIIDEGSDDFVVAWAYMPAPFALAPERFDSSD